MSIGDTITEPIPAVSTSGTGYASQLVAFLEEVKARLEARVPLSSLLPGLFDLDNNAIENGQYVGLYEQTDTSSEPVGSIFNYQGNLWYVSNAGAAQITSGASLNAAGIGGINGDYGGVNPASVYFSDVDQTYYFYDDGGALDWARIAARSIDIYGTLTETERVRITWGGGGNWTLTLPTAPPASTSIVQMDSSGNLTASNSIPSPTATDFYHGDRTVMQSFKGYEESGGTGYVTFQPFGTNAWAWSLAATKVIVLHINGLKTGDRIKSVRVYGSSSANGTTQLWVQNYDDSIQQTVTTSGTYNTTGYLHMAIDTPYELIDGDVPWIIVTAGADSIEFTHVQVVYDRPA